MALLLGGGAAVAVAACGTTDTGGGEGCVSEEEIFCRCRGGIEGTKTCLADGGFGECTTIDGPCPEIPEDSSSGDDDDDGDGPQPVCFPFDEITCACDDGTNGIQTCDAEGQSYGECTALGAPCGAGSSATTGASTGSGSGTASLFEPCGDASECKTGACLMGFCTKECGNWSECVDDGDIQGECARFAGGVLQLCAPYCADQAQCTDPYGEDSRCGFGAAPDDPQFGFTVCGDWGDDLAVPPEGWECEADLDCHLNLAGAERICSIAFEQCIEGCYEDLDCPGAELCSSDGSVPGTCG